MSTKSLPTNELAPAGSMCFTHDAFERYLFDKKGCLPPGAHFAILDGPKKGHYIAPCYEGGDTTQLVTMEDLAALAIPTIDGLTIKKNANGDWYVVDATPEVCGVISLPVVRQTAQLFKTYSRSIASSATSQEVLEEIVVDTTEPLVGIPAKHNVVTGYVKISQATDVDFTVQPDGGFALTEIVEVTISGRVYRASSKQNREDKYEVTIHFEAPIVNGGLPIKWADVVGGGGLDAGASYDASVQVYLTGSMQAAIV